MAVDLACSRSEPPWAGLEHSGFRLWPREAAMVIQAMWCGAADGKTLDGKRSVNAGRTMHCLDKDGFASLWNRSLENTLSSG